MTENTSVLHNLISDWDMGETTSNTSLGNTSIEANATSCTTGGRHSYIFLMIPIIYTIIFVVGVLGNSMVVIVIYCYLKLTTVANVFLLNLALADLIFVITLPFWAAYTAMKYRWTFGNFLCKTSATVVLLNMNASVFLITCLSVDRYLAIVHPVKSRTRRTVVHARIACIGVWLLAGFASLPATFFRNASHYDHWNRTICAFDYPQKYQKQWIFGMALLKTLLGFLIPLLIILVCYSLIIKSLVQTYQVRRNRPTSNEAFKLIVAVVVSFILCWLPFQVFTFLDVLSRLEIIQNCRIPEIVDTSIPFTICMAYFNSCLNPILYGFVGHNFREKLFLFLRCMPPEIKNHSSLSTKLSSLSYRTIESLTKQMDISSAV
ncbi:type-1 angiotensin II receptor-like [Pristis pectinata]|uniref:type-1 angiotensin II receptor-like n=1 Tax=Pristis pectinata TaxID=685728 RepID=UPI00223D6298|nr:type-1 angiotensin II receptor-like [Pristis pectinata]XP_051874200.1 type-1 angiotensin II receptor-like [Pristis pectinata]